ncbi:hypothetical protein [Listeria grayi]|uniref:hypothetical protein n=1 Tax=Listeria grayi TaxID=1641 RepID=UPI0016241055|nr:hypothetical protein [Listeria grayi]MBC1921032.1 hypothetical protein [Listeria grayi]
MGKNVSIGKKITFWVVYLVAAVCFVLTIIAFFIGFLHHLHDTGGWRSVIEILATPITGFLKMTKGVIEKSFFDMLLLVVVSYIMPILFIVFTSLLKKRRQLED